MNTSGNWRSERSSRADVRVAMTSVWKKYVGTILTLKNILLWFIEVNSKTCVWSVSYINWQVTKNISFKVFIFIKVYYFRRNRGFSERPSYYSQWSWCSWWPGFLSTLSTCSLTGCIFMIVAYFRKVINPNNFLHLCFTELLEIKVST